MFLFRAMFLTETKSCFCAGFDLVESTIDSVDCTQRIMLIELKNRLFKNFLCLYELLKVRFWEREGILSIKILVFLHTLEILYLKSEQVFLSLKFSKWSLT